MIYEVTDARRRAIFGAVAGVLLPIVARGQADYPNRPITIVVPFPAGGPTDASARMYAKLMAETLGQSIVIDNRAGAAGTAGSAHVARATPDGYTLLWGGTSTLATAPGLYKEIRCGIVCAHRNGAPRPPHDRGKPCGRRNLPEGADCRKANSPERRHCRQWLDRSSRD